jgi:Response regulator containing a CheY-like receiver domain and an HD-GYP domain
MGEDNRLAEPPTCLIVDDEPRLRQVLMHLMRADGFRCLEAGNGVEALDVLAREPVTLLLSDMQMPKMSGIDLLREVRGRYPDVAVVMITGNADVEIAVGALSLGAMDYIVKPFQLEEVRARVVQALEKRRLILENRDYQERLEDRVQAQQRRLEELFLAGIQSLSQALEAKDPYTRGHSVRVASYASCVARELGVGADLIRQIELGGQVHDIGKIGVREEVLNKPGPLTPEEYEHIMTHPVIGWRILAPLLGDAPHSLNIVRWHHERFDGKGLPDRLARQSIPIEARIVAAADSLDAITSDRPYRVSEMTMLMAVEELIRCKGTQFDPDVVDAVVKCAGRGELRLLPRVAAVTQSGPVTTFS